MTYLPENNFILARSQEHKMILETVGEMEACLKFSSAKELIHTLKNLIEAFKRKLLLHQKMEEQVIFSAGLETIPSEKVIVLILQLQREHGIFEATIDSVIDKLWNFDEEDRNRIAIQKELENFIIQIKKHSLMEIKNLFPILSQNPRCKQLIDSLAAKIQF